MRNHLTPFLCAMLLLTVVAFGCNSFGDPLISVKGVVKNSSNEPVAGASVIIKKRENGEVRNATLEQITKEDGVFNFSLIGNAPADSFIIVNKDGFKPYNKDLTIKPAANTLEITLEPAVK